MILVPRLKNSLAEEGRGTIAKDYHRSVGRPCIRILSVTQTENLCFGVGINTTHLHVAKSFSIPIRHEVVLTLLHEFRSFRVFFFSLRSHIEKPVLVHLKQ